MPTIKLLRKRYDNVRTLRKIKYQEIYQDKRWKRLRKAKMRANPLCERCESYGRVVPADEVHHRIPFDTGSTPEEVENLAFDWDNLESLCDPCHDKRHDDLKKGFKKAI